ncbi:MAG: TlpA family protein disulfide reductase, partial [Calditrichales bacterium]
FGLTFPLLVDEKIAVAGLYKVTGLPTTFFIDRNGMIFKKHIGWLDEAQILKIFENM